MKKNSGISVLSLIITIIVIIIITSITVYTGMDALESANEKSAIDTLKIIANALTRDDTFLIFDLSGDAVLTDLDFEYMDLEGYYEENALYKINKVEEVVNNSKVVRYTLTREEIGTTKKYQHVYTYELKNEVTNYDVVFDTEKGVNMPIVLEDMTPLMPDGVTPVEDVYMDNWYSYDKRTSSFAKVEYNGKIYVWVPRFAYRMQTFYSGKPYPEVPSTAIDIVYINGNANYMSNHERVPSDYRIHPAFTNGAIEYAGLWYEYTAEHVISNVTAGSIIQTETKSERNINLNLHMMTNMEAGAIMYLMFANECTDEVELNSNEYVAAHVNGAGPFNTNFVTIYPALEISNSLTGDAIRETPWKRVIGNYPTIAKPYIIRRYGSSLFDYTNSDGSDEANARGVIAIF